MEVPQKGGMDAGDIAREAIAQAILPEVQRLLRIHSEDKRAPEVLAGYAAGLALSSGWSSGGSLVELLSPRSAE